MRYHSISDCSVKNMEEAMATEGPPMHNDNLLPFPFGLLSCRRAEGVSLAEVLVAMMLLTLGLLAALSGFRWAQAGLSDGERATRALALAESRLEAKRTTSWATLLQDDADGDGLDEQRMRDDGGGEDEHAGDGRYTGSWTEDGIHLVWTIQPDRPGPLWQVGSVLIQVQARYRTAGGPWRHIHLGALRANPNYIGYR